MCSGVRACIENRYPLTLATVVGSGSPDRARLGDFLAVRGGQRVDATIGDAHLLSEIDADAKGTPGPSSTPKTFASSAGEVEVFFELISPPLPLVIFERGRRHSPRGGSEKPGLACDGCRSSHRVRIPPISRTRTRCWWLRTSRQTSSWATDMPRLS